MKNRNHACIEFIDSTALNYIKLCFEELESSLKKFYADRGSNPRQRFNPSYFIYVHEWSLYTLSL